MKIFYSNSIFRLIGASAIPIFVLLLAGAIGMILVPIITVFYFIVPISLMFTLVWYENNRKEDMNYNRVKNNLAWVCFTGFLINIVLFVAYNPWL